jgi:hypothetical protein
MVTATPVGFAIGAVPLNPMPVAVNCKRLLGAVLLLL